MKIHPAIGMRHVVGYPHGRLIYLKSIFAGMVAVLLVAALLFAGIETVVLLAYRQGDADILWDPRSLVSPISVLVVLAVFVAGFLWELRRAPR